MCVCVFAKIQGEREKRKEKNEQKQFVKVLPDVLKTNRCLMFCLSNSVVTRYIRGMHKLLGHNMGEMTFKSSLAQVNLFASNLDIMYKIEF